MNAFHITRIIIHVYEMSKCRKVVVRSRAMRQRIHTTALYTLLRALTIGVARAMTSPCIVVGLRLLGPHGVPPGRVRDGDGREPVFGAKGLSREWVFGGCRRDVDCEHLSQGLGDLQPSYKGKRLRGFGEPPIGILWGSGMLTAPFGENLLQRCFASVSGRLSALPWTPSKHRTCRRR